MKYNEIHVIFTPNEPKKILISTRWINDQRLSLAAKGLLAFLTYCKEWHCPFVDYHVEGVLSLEDIAKGLNNTPEIELKSLFEELKEYHYIDENGKLDLYDQ